MSESPFNPNAIPGKETAEERAVRFIINTSVDDGKRSIKTNKSIPVLREALKRERTGTNRTSITKPLVARIKKLKAAAVAAVEVIVLEDTLDDCTTGVRTAATRIEKEHDRYQRITKYDRVLIGLWLLKAKHLNLAPNNASRGGGRGNKKETVSNVGHGLDGGFLAWLKETCPDIPRSTAYNYLNAAINAGLTIESTEADVAKLKKSKALDDTSIKDLYKSPTLLADTPEDDDEPEPEETQSKFCLIRDTLTTARKQCDNLLALKDDMTEAAHETACARLARTLEELTGSKWGPVPDDHAHTLTEHPEAYELGS